MSKPTISDYIPYFIPIFQWMLISISWKWLEKMGGIPWYSGHIFHAKNNNKFPEGFRARHGRQLTASCWRERFTAFRALAGGDFWPGESHSYPWWFNDGLNGDLLVFISKLIAGWWFSRRWTGDHAIAQNTHFVMRVFLDDFTNMDSRWSLMI